MENRIQSAGFPAQVSDSPAPTGLPPLPMRAGDLPMSEVVNLYMRGYTGRDPTRQQRLSWWVAQVGTIKLQDLSDDDVHAAIEMLAAQPSSSAFAQKSARLPSARPTIGTSRSRPGASGRQGMQRVPHRCSAA
jgi:hypothetical protein